jgi:hypothetical protein
MNDRDDSTRISPNAAAPPKHQRIKAASGFGKQIRYNHRLAAFIRWKNFCFLICIILNFPLFAQTPNLQLVTVQPGQSVRQLAEKYFGDANLWEEILKQNQLRAANEIKPGMQLKISLDAVQLAARQLAEALRAIENATEAGAKVYAADSIQQAIALYNEAVASRQAGEWDKSFKSSQAARRLADVA